MKLKPFTVLTTIVLVLFSASLGFLPAGIAAQVAATPGPVRPTVGVPVGATSASLAACPDFVKNALATTNQLCADTGRNKLCYGNVSINAQPQPGITDLAFTKPGDIVDVDKIHQLQLGALNTDQKTWGVALMRIQANLPDTAAGQNVTLVLFGDVQLENAANNATSPATAGVPVYGPMQAFYFRSGIGTAACKEAPHNGILIQTPKGQHPQVTMSINGVTMTLGSTVYLTLEADGSMGVYTLEGQVQVQANGTTQSIGAGTSANIPLNANRQPSGPPGTPQPYDASDIQGLPVDTLPVAITPATPVATGTPGN